MLLRILAVGDVVSEAGLAYLERRLRRLQREHNVDFTVVNGENAAGIGVLPWQAQAILDAGADVVTLGNHTWGKIKIHDFLDDCRACLRPANFAPELPGNGWGIFESVNGLRVGVINLIGRVSMDPNVDNPFRKADAILEQMAGGADVVVVDFHAEATSEKLAMGWYLDGRVSALWGTHTHVPTADGQILPKGTGLITDLTTGENFQAQPFPPFIQDIIRIQPHPVIGADFFQKKITRSRKIVTPGKIIHQRRILLRNLFCSV